MRIELNYNNGYHTNISIGHTQDDEYRCVFQDVDNAVVICLKEDDIRKLANHLLILIQ